MAFILKRRQFPRIRAYVITINKLQGQSSDHVGIDLQTASSRMGHYNYVVV